MEEQFYTILTKLGKSKLIEANVSGKKLDLVKFQIGDGSGSYYNPTEDQMELKHKVWEGLISNITVDENNPNWVVIETVLPNDIGSFMIREAGVFDAEGNLIAIGKYPETYKPVADEGSSKELVIKMILELSNTSSVTLKIDKSLILATKKDIEILENKIKNVESPVKSVNNKTGDVELKTEDIKHENGQTLKSSLDDIKTKNESLDTSKVNNTDFNSYKKDYVVNNAFGRTTGISTNYILTLNPAPTSYKEGMNITIIPHVECGDNPTLNINNLGASNIVKQDGNNISAKYLKANVPVSLVRVGNCFFISSGGYRSGDEIPADQINISMPDGAKVKTTTTDFSYPDYIVRAPGSSYVVAKIGSQLKVFNSNGSLSFTDSGSPSEESHNPLFLRAGSSLSFVWYHTKGRYDSRITFDNNSAGTGIDIPDVKATWSSDTGGTYDPKDSKMIYVDIAKRLFKINTGTSPWSIVWKVESIPVYWQVGVFDKEGYLYIYGLESASAWRFIKVNPTSGAVLWNIYIDSNYSVVPYYSLTKDKIFLVHKTGRWFKEINKDTGTTIETFTTVISNTYSSSVSEYGFINWNIDPSDDSIYGLEGGNERPFRFTQVQGNSWGGATSVMLTDGYGKAGGSFSSMLRKSETNELWSFHVNELNIWTLPAFHIK